MCATCLRIEPVIADRPSAVSISRSWNGVPLFETRRELRLRFKQS